MIIKYENITSIGVRGGAVGGIIMGGFCAIMGSFSYALLGFITFFLMGLIMILWGFSHGEKKAEKGAKILCEQIEASRKVLCQGTAKHVGKLRALTHGWMFVSEDAVEFYAIKGDAVVGSKSDNIAILLDDIQTIDIGKDLLWGDKILITTTENTYHFLVGKPNTWKEQIELAIKG